VSIAVPVFDRPRQLRNCLESIVAEVDRLATDTVEVWVTDDASTDGTAAVARDFAQSYRWIGFRENDTNKGLEGNLMESIRPCSGRFVWLMGSDDLLAPNGLAPVLEAVAADSCDLLIFNKQRVDQSLERRLPDSRGHLPPGIEAGQSADYESPLDLARQTGIVSAFGFTSQVLWRRKRVAACDPTPYVGLMMYPHVGLVLEAFSNSHVRCFNNRVVLQRTLTQEQKLAEYLGSGEETFMAAKEERNRRWFGAGYAALLQRVVDRTELEAADFRGLPERLLHEDSMLEFIGRNWRAAEEVGLLQDETVVADAVRLFESLGLPIPRQAPAAPG
jgi:hypothetical protein